MSLYELVDECEYETAAEYYSAATLDGSFHSRESSFLTRARCSHPAHDPRKCPL